MLRYRELSADGDRIAGVGLDGRTIDLFDASGRWLRRVEMPLTLREHAWALIGDSIALTDWREGTERRALDGSRMWAWRDLKKTDALSWLPRADRIAIKLGARLRLLSPTTGKWAVEVRGARAADRADGVLVLEESGRARAIDLEGHVTWRSAAAIPAPLRCADIAGLALLGGAELAALDAATGELRWRFAPGPKERVVQIAEVDHGIAIVVIGRPAPARIVVLDREGRPLHDRELRGTSFVFSSDRVVSNTGEIVRLADHQIVGALAAPE